jgi:hypothetical protein
MATKRLKRPRDPVQLGKLIGDIAKAKSRTTSRTIGTLLPWRSASSEVKRVGRPEPTN